MQVRSVIDIGCARGTWLREWRAQAVDDVVGVDGDYVDRSRLEIDPHCFFVCDLAAPFNLGRRFDLAQSLEVAEHLPPSRAGTFVADIVAHAPVVLFSAATRGQGGENHINERAGSYWQQLFLEHDYVAVDCLRPLLAAEKNIPAWYRHNIILYVQRDRMAQIAPFAREFQIRDGEQVPDVSPWAYKLRQLLVRFLPLRVRNHLARRNARRYSRIQGREWIF